MSTVSTDRRLFPSPSPPSFHRSKEEVFLSNHYLLSTVEEDEANTHTHHHLPLRYRSKIFLVQVLLYIFSTKALLHKSIQVLCNNAHCWLCVFAFARSLSHDSERYCLDPDDDKRQSFDYNYKGQTQIHLPPLGTRGGKSYFFCIKGYRYVHKRTVDLPLPLPTSFLFLLLLLCVLLRDKER